MYRWRRFNGKKNIKQIDESVDRVVATVPLLALGLCDYSRKLGQRQASSPYKTAD
jgi:hypothetical protein